MMPWNAVSLPFDPWVVPAALAFTLLAVLAERLWLDNRR